MIIKRSPAKPDACRRCPLAAEGRGFAYGEGQGRIMFVGEALGETEAALGRPFIGPTGSMLRRMIHQAGIGKDEFYITNTVKCQPPGNRKPTREEITFCSQNYLFKEIQANDPNIIVAVGDTALRCLAPKVGRGVTSVRGTIIKTPYGKVLPIVHPSFVARGNPEFWPITVVDLLKAKNNSHDKTITKHEENFCLFPTIHDVRWMYKHLTTNNLKFAFDIETIGRREQTNIRCCGFAWSAHDALCVPFLVAGGDPYWPPDEEEEVWSLMCDLFDSELIKITQNGFVFDLPVLMDLGVKFRRHTVVDTLVKHHVVATELPHSLEFLSSIYTPLEHYKGVGVDIWTDATTLHRYNLRDCIATWIANEEIDKEMAEQGLL